MTIMHRTLGLSSKAYKLIPTKVSCRRKCLHPWKNLKWYLTSLGERKAKTIGIGEFALKSGIIRHCADTFIFSTAIPSRRKGWQPFVTFAKGSPHIRGKLVVLCPFSQFGFIPIRWESSRKGHRQRENPVTHWNYRV